MPPLNFPERGPRQAPKTHREARFGAGAYSSPRGGQRSAARPLDGTRTGRTPRNLRWKGNQRSTIHRSQRRWRPTATSTFSPRWVGVPEGPLTPAWGETPSPVGGAPLESRSAARDGRGARTGMENEMPASGLPEGKAGGMAGGRAVRRSFNQPSPPKPGVGNALKRSRSPRWGDPRSQAERVCQLLSCSPRCRTDTSLIYPPTYSGQKFRWQTQKWRFCSGGETFLYVFCQFTAKVKIFFPYKKSAEVSPKNFF